MALVCAADLGGGQQHSRRSLQRECGIAGDAGGGQQPSPAQPAAAFFLVFGLRAARFVL